MPQPGTSEARSGLSVLDAVVILVGIVVGVGIFRTPSLVASQVDSEAAFLGVWLIGGLITLVGALCYAELSAAHPQSGGEYHFLSRAYGRPVAMLFGWARSAVIQTGAIAAVAFVLGDYAAAALPLGPYGSAVYAALAVVMLTAVNIAGTFQSKTLQLAVTTLEIGAILAIIGLGLLAAPEATAPSPVSAPAMGSLGLALVFVLLTYGGWNEASYLTGEVRDAPRNIARVFLIGTALLVGLYLLVNIALLAVLGLEGLRRSDAVAADMMRVVAGEAGAGIVTAAVVVAAVSTLNATIFTGARSAAALARDVTWLARMGEWNQARHTPTRGLLLQGAVALALVGFGAATQDGFRAMVDYGAPVFWGFMLMTGLALFVLRWREPERVLPFRVPLYPLTPILFCLACAYMLHSSIAYTGLGALVGLAAVAAGAPLLLFRRREVPPLPASSP
ncbi:APC family permease [Roseomonas sp. KE0001]|uniref:APC family permease n=1 Tax=Roseomonas sp. KE0001 TaxID=2479201 RepID=UPI0018DFF471|nr:amino acid permease [Roseomonas sp. KE0001]MBI0433325.1 amino acid permease [Roseomonas sp. KE0001]